MQQATKGMQGWYIEVQQKKWENDKLKVLLIQGNSKMCRDLRGKK